MYDAVFKLKNDINLQRVWSSPKIAMFNSETNTNVDINTIWNFAIKMNINYMLLNKRTEILKDWILNPCMGYNPNL